MATIAPKREDRNFNNQKPEYLDIMRSRSTLDAEDIEGITDFLEERKALKKISKARVQKLWWCLIHFQREAGVPYRDMDWKCIIRTINQIQESGKYKQNTIRDSVASAKMFLTWLVKHRKATISRDELEELSLPKPEKSPIRPEDLISDEEKNAMIKACFSPRDAVIISLIWETGLRPIEVGHLRASDIELTKDGGMIVYVKEKTERTRRIPAPITTPFYKTWSDFAPYPLIGDVLVFPSLTPIVETDGSRRYQPMKGDALRQQLKAIAERAGITRRIIPYMFRHTAISDMLNSGVPERMVMKLSHGGHTQMLNVYWHAEDQKIEDVVLEKRHGIKKEMKKEIEKKITDRKCGNCGKVVSSLFEWCPFCRSPMTEAAQARVEDISNLVVDLPAEKLVNLINIMDSPQFKTLLEQFTK